MGLGGEELEVAATVQTPRHVASIRNVDWDGNARPDFAVLRIAERRVTVLRGLGPASYELSAFPLAGSGPTAIIAEDLNGDDRTDLVVTTFLAGNISILLADATETIGKVGRWPRSDA